MLLSSLAIGWNDFLPTSIAASLSQTYELVAKSYVNKSTLVEEILGIKEE